MKNLKYSVVFAMLALAIAPSSATLKKWFGKDKDVVVVPIQLEQLQPIQQVQYVEHVEQAQVEPIDSEPGQIVKLWGHVKDKTIVPLKKIFTKKDAVPVPDYRVWPSLGFSHYKKVQYYPTKEHVIVDPQIPLEFPTYFVERIPAPIPIQQEYNVPYTPALTVIPVPHQEYNVPYPPAPTALPVPHQEYNVPYPYPQPQESNNDAPGSPGAEFAPYSA